MRNTKSSGQLAPAAINFNLLLIVPYSVIEFEVNPFGYIQCFSSDHFDASALVTTAGNPIQDIGFINQAIVPQSGRHFALKHAVPPPFLELADFPFGGIILSGPSASERLSLIFSLLTFFMKSACCPATSAAPPANSSAFGCQHCR
jgi:hypothetical protein